MRERYAIRRMPVPDAMSMPGALTSQSHFVVAQSKDCLICVSLWRLSPPVMQVRRCDELFFDSSCKAAPRNSSMVLD